MISKGDLSGIVLIGGKSSRMGMPKHGLVYHNENQVNFSVALLKLFCHEVFISCNNEQALSFQFSNEIIVDNPEYSDSGPIAGVLSSLEKTKNGILVIGCDYPYLSDMDITQLIAERNENACATVFENPDDHQPEPLIGIYEKNSVAFLKNNFQAGKYSLRKFLQENRTKLISIHKKNALKSIDTKKEYEIVKKSIQD